MIASVRIGNAYYGLLLHPEVCFLAAWFFIRVSIDRHHHHNKYIHTYYHGAPRWDSSNITMGQTRALYFQDGGEGGNI